MSVRALTFAVALLAASLLAVPAGSQTQPPLRIYSSLPLQGDAGPQSADVVRGMRMALDDRGSMAAGRSIEYVSLDDSTRATGSWEPGQVSANARKAAGDAQTIAYLGDFNSGASAVSIPITNEAGILQISPSNTYVGLTRSEAAERGEPDKYYPSGRRTYGRVAAADHKQSDALVAWMRALRVKRLFIAHDGEVYGQGMGEMVRRRAARAGIRIVAFARARNPRSVARRAGRSNADAFFYGGITQTGAVDIFRLANRADRRMRLLGPDGVADSDFAEGLPTAAARRTHVTNLTLDPGSYPPAGQAFFARFRDRHRKDPEPYAIYGYEALSLALDAIDRAGARSREAVVDAFFATRDRDSVLGRYSIDPNGDTTLPLYGGYRVKRKQFAFDRVLDASR